MSVPCNNFLLICIGHSMGFSTHSERLFSSEMEHLLRSEEPYPPNKLC